MASDMSVFFNTDDFAEDWTYTPTGGEPTTVTVIPDQDDYNQEPFVRGTNTNMEIDVQASEVTNPQHGDVFNDGSDDWELDPEAGVLEKDDNVYCLSLRRIDS